MGTPPNSECSHTLLYSFLRMRDPRALPIIEARPAIPGKNNAGGTLLSTPAESFNLRALAADKSGSEDEQCDTEHNPVEGKDRKSVAADPKKEPLDDAQSHDE